MCPDAQARFLADGGVVPERPQAVIQGFDQRVRPIRSVGDAYGAVLDVIAHLVGGEQR